MTRQDVEAVVDKLDEMRLIRKHRITNNWYTIYCPFHRDGQEKRPSCGVLLEDEVRNGQRYKAGQFHCFTCGAAYSLEAGVNEILKMKAVPSSGIEWLKENIPGFSLDFTRESLVPSSLLGSVIDKFAADNLRSRMSVSHSYITEAELAKYRFTVPYMYQRRLTDPIIYKYDVGYDANHIPSGRSKPLPCVTFPVRDRQGNTLFICRRSIEGKYFNYPSGVSKPVYGLYELPEDCRSVIICESIFNCLTAEVYGYHAVALLGTGTPYQIEQLKKLGVREYVLCLDPDDAGRKGTAKLKKALSSSGFVFTINMPEGKDLNDCDKTEFDELYARKE